MAGLSGGVNGCKRPAGEDAEGLRAGGKRSRAGRREAKVSCDRARPVASGARRGSWRERPRDGRAVALPPRGVLPAVCRHRRAPRVGSEGPLQPRAPPCRLPAAPRLRRARPWL